MNLSRSTWACELKFDKSDSFINDSSHAPRERVSWNNEQNFKVATLQRHAPRERVSWNEKFPTIETIFDVTLHVSVWVEICELYVCRNGAGVTLHVSVWVEIHHSVLLFYRHTSRSTWACELKCAWEPFPRWPIPSRSTWACELKWFLSFYPHQSDIVTLHVSVWVEMLEFENVKKIKASRSTWACELKFTPPQIQDTQSRHAPRERVSWNHKLVRRLVEQLGHAPRERVSWNCNGEVIVPLREVTLHVSVWVEISTATAYVL